MPKQLPDSIYEAEKYHVCEAMVRFGGSFTRKLGEALRSADATNYRLVLETWEASIQAQYDMYRTQYDNINNAKSK